MLSLLKSGLFSRRRALSLSLVAGLLAAAAIVPLPQAKAEEAQEGTPVRKGRLSSLLIRKSDLYMPTRLVIGEDARFVVRAQAGSKVKVFLSTGSAGYVLPNGTPLRVGSEVQELTGIVPENGILELHLEMPKDAELDGKVLYVDAASGLSDEALMPIDLIDATGRRAESNVLVISKPAERGGPNIMPSMPGLDPQLFNKITTMGEIYSKGDDHRKELLDTTGEINRNREADRNPFVNQGMQPGLK